MAHVVVCPAVILTGCVHAPLAHPQWHVVPHAPQFFAFVARLMHVALHTSGFSAGQTHDPDMQTAPVFVHAVEQLPHASGFV